MRGIQLRAHGTAVGAGSLARATLDCPAFILCALIVVAWAAFLSIENNRLLPPEDSGGS